MTSHRLLPDKCKSKQVVYQQSRGPGSGHPENLKHVGKALSRQCGNVFFLLLFRLLFL